MKVRRVDAKVATIISNSQIALNTGSADGVEPGAIVQLFRTVEIKDPDNKESLGSVRLLKLSLRVTMSEARFCIASVIDLADDSDDSTMRGLFTLASGRRYKKINDSKDIDFGGGVPVAVGEYAAIDIPVEDD